MNTCLCLKQPLFGIVVHRFDCIWCFASTTTGTYSCFFWFERIKKLKKDFFKFWKRSTKGICLFVIHFSLFLKALWNKRFNLLEEICHLFVEYPDANSKWSVKIVTISILSKLRYIQRSKGQTIFYCWCLNLKMFKL